MSKVIRNSDFLAKAKPIKIVLVSIIIWAFLFFSAPLKVNIDLDLSAYILMSLSMIALLLAFYIKSKSFKSIEVSSERLTSVFWVVLIVASMGVLLKLTDKFIIRGISFGAGSMLNRDMAATGSGNPIGIIGSLLAPFSYVPLFLFWKYKLKLWWALKIVVYGLFISQIIDATLLGSRSAIFVNIVILLLYLIYFKKIRFGFKTYLTLILGTILFLTLMNYIFIKRTQEVLGDEVYDIVLNESNFNFTSTANDNFKKEFRQLGEIQKSIYFSYIVTVQYITHGVLEFSYLYSNFEKQHTYGRYTFDIYFRMIGKVIPSAKIDDPESITPRSGVYTTLLGPLFVDFGWFLIPFMFGLGRGIKIVYESAKAGSDWAIILYFYIILILAFWPILNFINGAGGVYTITSILLFGGISSSIYAKKS